MDEWADEVVTEVMQSVNEDALYQAILEQCRNAEIEYTKIIEKMSDYERIQADWYIALCEELRFARLAYCYGMRKGMLVRDTSE